MLACAVVQPHADEAALVADRRIEAVAAHVDLGLLRQLEVASASASRRLRAGACLRAERASTA